MIDRLHVTLRALSELSVRELTSPVTERLRRDCADAVRLQLDCPQGDLRVTQRDVLRRLDDLLEAPEVRGSELAAAIQEASIALASRV
jgi:hypothetical protein